MVIKIFLIITIILNIAFAQYERPGSSAAQFLDIGVSARAEAMGGAYISVAEGAEGVYYNTAAIFFTKKLDLFFSYTDWFAGINLEFFSMAYKLSKNNMIAFSGTALQTDEMKVRTPFQPDGTGETFYAGSYRFGLSYARALTNHVFLGITGNFIKLYLYRNFIENAYAGDIAVLFDTGIRKFRFGFIISNFGSNIKFVNEAYPMPTKFSFGLSVNAIQQKNNNLLLSVSAIKPNDGKPKLNLGAEYSYINALFLRGGYNFEDRVKTFGVGVGVKLKMNSYILNIDYSYNNFKKLGGAQRISLRFNL